LEKGAIFEHDQLAWAKEKCLASAVSHLDEFGDKKSPKTENPPKGKTDEPILMGALVSNDEASSLHVFEVVKDALPEDAGGMRFKTGDQLELPLLCEQWENRYLGGVVCFGKFIFVGTLMCKVKITDY